MSQNILDEALIRKTIDFHGHSCPGLAIGMRVSELVLAEIGRASDEEMVAVVETDMCGVDAIQFLTGCTFGKGNLIHMDHGKNAFTFYRRSDGKAIRILLRPDIFKEPENDLTELREKPAREKLTPDEQIRVKDAVENRKKRIMDAPLDYLFDISPVKGPIPEKARIMDSIPCQACGEPTMETRTRRFQGQILCIPCFVAMEKRY